MIFGLEACKQSGHLLTAVTVDVSVYSNSRCFLIISFYWVGGELRTTERDFKAVGQHLILTNLINHSILVVFPVS